MTRTPGLGPRFAAWRILHDVRHGVPFDLALRRAIQDLEPGDKRLAHELAAGVFRSRSALDLALKPAVERGLGSVRADTLDVLRLGAFQVIQLDRVPVHAAVQTSVAVARRLGGRRVAGFVNAVLRRVAEAAPRPEPTTDGADPVATLAVAHSHPEWLVGRWLARFGAEATERLLVWNNTTPSLVIQPARWSRARLEEALTERGIGFETARWDAGLVVQARRPVDLPGFHEGAFYVQDPAQRQVTRFFDLPPDQLIYDACAAPGGKSLALARTARFLVAADRQRPRARRLRENLARAGTGPAAVIVADATRPPLRSAPALVLDVPCLGTGTLARNPDARWRITEPALEHLVTQAAGFLETAADIVEPGGLLLFATCSLESEENEQQVDRFLAHDRRFRREPWSDAPPDTLTAQGDLMILPHIHGTDGAFAARLRRVAA
jgi:16S rRNA (cytosine967-C5)-methyltransferase